MTWDNFYTSIRANDWPDCISEDDFNQLPEIIKQECIDNFGYVPGQFKSQSKLPHRVFPIQTETACQLKWTWSTVYLSAGNTASCHRTTRSRFDLSKMNFHNTSEKLEDRRRMLLGQWPETGCEYCRDIEAAGGQSDRITNLDFYGVHAPPELESNPEAIEVTPRILEIYFDNKCNLKCLYCSSNFSSLWDEENIAHGAFSENGVRLPGKYAKDPDYTKNKAAMFEWLTQNSKFLTRLNILGGEPLYQIELDECLDLLDQHPAPELELEFFTNLKSPLPRVQRVVEKIKKLLDAGKIRRFNIVASIDCWGPEQEFVRYPLDLKSWERNFDYILSQDFINITIGSTVTPLTIKTLPELVERINGWNRKRKVHHYFNSVNSPSYLFIDILGDIFIDDFQKVLELMPECTIEQVNVKNYMRGIAKESASKGVNKPEILKLRTFLDEIDRRRKTNWRGLFPWLEQEFLHILTD